MSVPCEIAVKCVLPVLRAMIAKEFTTIYSLKQIEAAKLLRVSQPAISLYYRNMRGKAIDLENDPDIKALVARTAESLVKKQVSHKDLIPMYCEMCKMIRKKGLLCKLHRAFDPEIEIEKCGLCMASSSTRC